MMTRRDARTALQHFEGLATERQCFMRTFGRSTLSIVKRGENEFEYIWGPNPVSKSIALCALETFGESNAR